MKMDKIFKQGPPSTQKKLIRGSATINKQEKKKHQYQQPLPDGKPEIYNCDGALYSSHAQTQQQVG